MAAERQAAAEREEAARLAAEEALASSVNQFASAIAEGRLSERVARPAAQAPARAWSKA